jgi:ribosomal protein S18 acetylase RimI-like enzyme
MDDRVLDNPVWAALTGPHAHLAERTGQAARYPADVSPFVALAGGDGWADLADLLGPGGEAGVAGGAAPPPDWTVLDALDGVQLVGSGVAGVAEPEAERLTPGDVPEMLDLVARTRPGPFRPRTIAMGTYLGVRRDGRLVAMAGERLRLPGWTEISAICTDPDHRGQGLAGRLTRAVAAGILARGDIPFLHAAASNTDALRLYRALGFQLRRPLTFWIVRSPGGAQAEPVFGGAEHPQRFPGGAQAEPVFGGAEHPQRLPGGVQAEPVFGGAEHPQRLPGGRRHGADADADADA